MSELAVGESLGRYQVLRKLADGGMAEIYLARIAGASGFEKLVVLKRIRPIVKQDRGALAMFLDEARLAATLHHSNIAEVIDVGEVGDTVFFAMEYVYGQDVRAIRERARKPLPLAVALAIIAGVASALAYAHAKSGPAGPLRIVHRDVSPSNIIVSYDGAMKLVDFGIARATSRTAKTLTGVLRGKVPYMSPEQARGKSLDARSDLFSLGSVLYELTLGKRPFSAKSEFELLEAIAHARAVPPSQIDPSYPPALEALVMRLLERDPSVRFQTADTLLTALEALVADLGIYISSLGVAKYMRDLFADEVADHHDFPASATVPVEIVPPPEAFRPGQNTDDETTAGFDRNQQRYIEPMRRAPTVQTAEVTNPDMAPMSSADSLAAFSEELEHELALEDLLDEPGDVRTRRHIDALVDRAFACYGGGELELAVTAVELALREDEASTSPIGFVHHHRSTIMAILEAFVGDPQQIARLLLPRDELQAMPELVRTRTLLERIDGLSSVEDLLVLSGMSPLETYRQLCVLLVRDVIELR